MRKSRCLIFIVAYNAETTIQTVVGRIPHHLTDQFDIEILIIDDSSQDKTFEKSYQLTQGREIPYKIIPLFNPVNQGYGGNQKLGYHFAIEHGYDFVVLLHGDGQYAPECLPDLLQPLENGTASAVFGSRMLTPKGALRGGMPLYKFVGNKILTWTQNRLLRSHLSEFHSGYRLYSVAALKAIPFEHNSNGFDFDTEIIIQLMIAGYKIVELPIPTFYGDEICRVDGLKYAANVIRTTLQARLQEVSLFYDRKYDCAPIPLFQKAPKVSFRSTHSFALDAIPAGANVIDLDSAGGDLCPMLKQRKNCRVTRAGTGPGESSNCLDKFYPADLNQGLDDIPVEQHDVVLMLDVIEHLARPEKFLDALRERLSLNPKSELIISTGNVAFIVTRLMLLLGYFNYSKRGILDLSHTRLLTFTSLRRLLEQAGFTITQTAALPAPFPLALGHTSLSRFLLGVNSFLIKLLPGLFSYQMIMRAQARPTVKWLLQDAHAKSSLRKDSLAAAGR